MLYRYEEQGRCRLLGVVVDREGEDCAAFAQGSEYPTMKHYLTDARLFHSTKLLSNNPEMSITEVALASGFTSIASFSHSFRERFAMTPSEFRNKTDMKIAAYIAKFPEDEE